MLKLVFLFGVSLHITGIAGQKAKGKTDVKVQGRPANVAGPETTGKKKIKQQTNNKNNSNSNSNNKTMKTAIVQKHRLNKNV